MPGVLGLVVLTVTGDGSMTVTLDGVPYVPAAFAPPWRREDFAVVLDEITARRRSPVRVEVREADGTTYTDIIAPTRRITAPRHHEPPTPEAAPAPALSEAEGDRGRVVVAHGAGFVPGEDVAVAVVTGHSDAAPDGTVRGLLTPTQLAGSPTGEVVLLGRVSGTLVIGRSE